MRKVNLQYARTHLDGLMDEALAGEDIVITKEEEGTALIRLQPVPSGRKRKFGLDEGKIVIRADFDDPMPELERAFYGDPHRSSASRGLGADDFRPAPRCL